MLLFVLLLMFMVHNVYYISTVQQSNIHIDTSDISQPLKYTIQLYIKLSTTFPTTIAAEHSVFVRSIMSATKRSIQARTAEPLQIKPQQTVLCFV